jgi:ribose transport system ATP-binding protein
MATHPMPNHALELTGIHKAFPGVQALTDVSMSVDAGEVHALLGENGAGKSTLLRILSGLMTADSGMVRVNGEPAHLTSPRAARNAGIAMIHQELQQVPELTVAQNMFLGRSISWAKIFNDHRTMRRMAREHLAKLDSNIDVSTKIGSLRVAQRQMVEIAKATLFDARIIAMDEPTSSLTPREFERLAEVIKDLAAQGVAIIYVSHKLDEVYRVASHATVLRDGRMVDEIDLARTAEAELVALMVGRKMNVDQKQTSHATKKVVLTAKGLTRGTAVRNVDLSLHQGEVLGIAGLVGSGRTELVRLLAGIDKPTAGSINVEGIDLAFRSPRHAIASGVALLPEDRKKEGIVPLRSVRSNSGLPSFGAFSRAGLIQSASLRARTLDLGRRVNLRPLDAEKRIMLFSGGNQQKAILVRWLMAGAKIMIFDEPTRGIDVGAKEEIYRLIETLAAEGRSIIVVSSELQEVLRVSDRILVMRAGRLAGELPKDRASQEAIMALAFSKSELEAA